LSAPSGILAIDVGNTLTKIVRVAAGRFEPVVVVSTGEDRGGLAAQVGALPPLPAWVCSVVAPALDPTSEALVEGGAVSVTVIGRDVPLPCAVDYGTPDTLGDDRVVAAHAAWRRHRKGAIIVDAGTAMTVDWIDGDGVFRGGAIAPGPGTLGAALNAAAPALPDVDPDPMARWPGRSTHESVIAGVTAAARGLVRDIVGIARERAGAAAAVVLTGGAAPLVTRLLDIEHEVAPDLLIEGIALVAALDRDGAS